MKLMRLAAAIISFATIPAPTAYAAEGVQAYCASVKDGDRVNQIPMELARIAHELYTPGGEFDAEYIMTSTVYRCMNWRVMLCNSGANIICAKPDLRTRMKEIDEYCRANPRRMFQWRLRDTPQYTHGDAPGESRL